MQCGVGRFTRLLQQAVESSEPSSTATLTLMRNEGWTYRLLKIVGHHHGFLRAKVEKITAMAPDYLWVSVGVPHEQPSSRRLPATATDETGGPPAKDGWASSSRGLSYSGLM
jgi:hypothetical protein